MDRFGAAGRWSELLCGLAWSGSAQGGLAKTVWQTLKQAISNLYKIQGRDTLDSVPADFC
jgi:hypothetical protein